MKRVGHLFEAILDRENLLLAFKKASQRKSYKPDVIEFQNNLEENISKLRLGLENYTFPIGQYKYFKIYDPKERIISAVPFPERVLHHALMNVCTPYFERFLVFDSYANRKGKGQFSAIKRAQQFASKYKWFLKCDIKKYFDSIDHNKLLNILKCKFKDKCLLAWFEKLIRSYSTTRGKGLPIGNLTSQYFANLYLDKIDRLHTPYVRYMDDFVFWSNDKEQLKSLFKKLHSILQNDLSLELKESSYINQTKFGMDFLGMRIFPNVVGLNRRSKVRYKKRLLTYIDLFNLGVITEYELQDRMKALTAFTSNTSCNNWRRQLIEDIGLYV